MKCFVKILAIIILIGTFFSNNFVLNGFVFAAIDSVNIGVTVSSTCPNGRCDLWNNETRSNCPLDCSCNNNGLCESAREENSGNCLSDCPPAPPAISFFADITPSGISNIFVENITMNSAEILWQTNEPSYCNLLWGKTFEYGNGSVAENFLKTKHLVEINELSIGTNYHFSIVCKDVNQNKTESNNNSFTTLPMPDIIPPANVSGFETTPRDSGIELKWRNPSDSDFDKVVVVRSEKFYPIDPFDGVIVYSGKGEKFIDTGLENNKPYYYTAFTYDKIGNYSSGAISATIPHLPGVIPPPISPVIVPAPEDVQKLKIEDFNFIQNSAKLRIADNNLIGVIQGIPLTISIDYEKVPEVLKTIMVTLEKITTGQGRENKYFSFLLKINKDKTAYEATIIPPEEIMDYPLSVTVMDYKNQQMKKIDAKLVVLQTSAISLLIPWQKKMVGELTFALMALATIEIIYRIHRKNKFRNILAN